MALKEKALKRLCGRLNKAGIPYLLTGAWMLSARGFEDAWHGFDVAVPGSCAEKADEVLTKLGMRTPVRETERSCEIHYHFDGADITLHGGYELPGDIRFEPPFAMDTTVVLGEEVPLMTLEDAFALSLLTGQEKEVERLRTCLLTRPFRLSHLTQALAAPGVLAQVPQQA